MSSDEDSHNPFGRAAVGVYSATRQLKDRRFVFHAYATAVRSLATPKVLLVYCEKLEVSTVSYPPLTTFRREKAEVFYVPTEAWTLTAEVIEKIQSLARDWGVEGDNLAERRGEK